MIDLSEFGWQIAAGIISGLIVATLLVIFRQRIRAAVERFITEGLPLHIFLAWTFLFAILGVSVWLESVGRETPLLLWMIGVLITTMVVANYTIRRK